MIRLQITRELIINFVVRVNKDYVIFTNSIDQVTLRMNHFDKTDFLFTSHHPKIPDVVVLVTQNAVMFSNQDTTSRQIKCDMILDTVNSIYIDHFAYTV